MENASGRTARRRLRDAGCGRGGRHSPWTRASWAETGGSAVYIQKGRLEAPSLPLSVSGNQQPASYYFFLSYLWSSSVISGSYEPRSLFKGIYYQDI